MKRWLLGGFGGLVALAGGVWGIGALLPVAHAASVSGVVPAAPADVWAAIIRVENHPEWRPGVVGVERLEETPDGRLLRWRETGPIGPLTFEVEGWEPPRRLVARIADEGLPFGGRWSYELEPAGDGGTGAASTRVTVTEEGEVYSPVFRFFSRFVFGHETTLREYLGALEARLAGEAAAGAATGAGEERRPGAPS